MNKEGKIKAVRGTEAQDKGIVVGCQVTKINESPFEMSLWKQVQKKGASYIIEILIPPVSLVNIFFNLPQKKEDNELLLPPPPPVTISKSGHNLKDGSPFFVPNFLKIAQIHKNSNRFSKLLRISKRCGLESIIQQNFLKEKMK